MESGDEDDFVLEDGDYSDAEAASESSASDASDPEETSDEEDAVDLSVGTPFDRMSKEDLSEHAKTGWTTYFEAESKYNPVRYRFAFIKLFVLSCMIR